jgi:hypothetical protein
LRAHTADADHARAGPQVEALALGFARWPRRNFDDPAFRKGRFARAVRSELEELEQNTRLVMHGHESAAALMAHDELLGRHGIERLADRALADVKLGGELGLARQGLARRPDAVDEPLYEGIARLRVEGTRAERRGFVRGEVLQPARHD